MQAKAPPLPQKETPSFPNQQNPWPSSAWTIVLRSPIPSSRRNHRISCICLPRRQSPMVSTASLLTPITRGQPIPHPSRSRRHTHPYRCTMYLTPMHTRGIIILDWMPLCIQTMLQVKKYNGEQKKFYTLALLLLERTTALYRDNYDWVLKSFTMVPDP